MLTCFTHEKDHAIPISLLNQTAFEAWRIQQPKALQSWLTATQFIFKVGQHCLLPGSTGQIERVVCCISDSPTLWDGGSLPISLPEGHYYFDVPATQYALFATGWALGAYQFTRYKKPERRPAQLYVSPEILADIIAEIQSIYLVRDLINTPTDDMGPTQLSDAAQSLAKTHSATFNEIVGEALLAQNYASIYTVGRASDDAPRLLDIRWGNATHPRVTLVGKGVCFDSGGLDIKSSPYMLLMKKDMGGAAHVLGLASMIMAAQLPVALRVLIPAVENAISGNAYRPGDIIKSRKGLTIEIGNTDAEGRVILADALFEAASEKPDLIIDMSTLTGAARVALGTEVAVLFANQQKIADDLLKVSAAVHDPMWQLPLYAPYREYLNSPIADINNMSTESTAGAITAALFLQAFVTPEVPWLHFDIMAWNQRAKPGRPVGGEAMAIRALFQYLKHRYQ